MPRRGGKQEIGERPMKNTDWINLLSLIPEEQQNTLVVTTKTGVDLNIEILLRTEETYLVFRGRVSGITDEGRVFFVPYGQIDYLQMNRQVKEAEIRRLYGDGDTSESGAFASSQSGVFAAVEPTSGSKQGLDANGKPTPTKPSLPGTAAKKSSPLIPIPRGANAPVQPAAGDGPTPPRNSILERLRAQRNSVVTTKPSGR
jgi:hypothetical protein